MSNQRTWNITQSSVLCGSHRKSIGKALHGFEAAAGLLWPCWVILLLQWKERSGVCRAGSASAFITIPGSRISTPGLSISFWYSIPSPSSILWWKQSHSSAIEHQSPVSYQVSVVGKKVSRKGSTKSPHQEPEANLVVWLQGLEG